MPVYKTVKYTLKKRGDAWQYNVRVNGERKRQQYTSEAEAIAGAEAVIDRGLEGMTLAPPKPQQFAKPTLQRVYEMLRDGKWKGTKGERTAKKNAEDCIVILGGGTTIDKITTENVDRLITELKDRELEPATIRRKLAALSTIIKFAAQRHWIDAVPLIDRSAAGKERKRLRYVSPQEEQDGLTYLRGYSSEDPVIAGTAADFFAFLMDTGLRLSEAVELKWTEVELDAKTQAAVSINLGFDNKGECPRMIPCTTRVAGILKARREQRPKEERRVWWNMTCDRAEWFWKLMREALKLVDDRDFVIHACRHTFASRLAQADVALTTIKELGGWKTLDMVMRYAHLGPSAKRDAIKRMQGGGMSAAG